MDTPSVRNMMTMIIAGSMVAPVLATISLIASLVVDDDVVVPVSVVVPLPSVVDEELVSPLVDESPSLVPVPVLDSLSLPVLDSLSLLVLVHCAYRHQ